MNREDIEHELIYKSSHDRFSCFYNLRHHLKGQDYWEVLSYAYKMSDNTYDQKLNIVETFLEKEPNSEMFMNSLERQKLASLPDKIKIYRGMTVGEFKSGIFGISWTLDPKVAHFFAFDYGRNFTTNGEEKMIHEMIISKKNVFAYLASRNEEEIIYLNLKNAKELNDIDVLS